MGMCFELSVLKFLAGYMIYTVALYSKAEEHQTADTHILSFWMNFTQISHVATKQTLMA